MNQQKKWLWRKPETMVDWIVIVFSSILFYMVLSNAGYVLGLLEKFMTILTPFAAGIVIAYIINPVVDWAHKYICRENKRLSWLSMLIGYIIAIVVVSVMAYLITTQVLTAIATFSANLSGYQANLLKMLDDLANWEHLPESFDLTGVKDYVGDLSNVAKTLADWLLAQVGKLDSIFTNVKDTFVMTFTALASRSFRAASSAD